MDPVKVLEVPVQVCEDKWDEAIMVSTDLYISFFLCRDSFTHDSLAGTVYIYIARTYMHTHRHEVHEKIPSTRIVLSSFSVVSP